MIKGVDYIGISVAFRCHDGKGNYLMHKRGKNCRDENGTWDFGGGGLKFGEKLEEGLFREVQEEYGVKPIDYTFLGFNEAHRKHNGQPTHWLVFRYKVLVDKVAVMNNEHEKHDEIQWFTLNSLPQPLHSVIRNNLETYISELEK